MVTLLLLKSSALKPDAPQRTAGCVHGWQLQDGAADDDDDDDAAPCGLACVDRGDRGSEGGVVDGGGSGGVSSGSDGGDGCGCGVVVVMVKEKELVSPKAHPYGSNSLQQRLYPERR